MNILIATVGLPGSGKTTWADNHVRADGSRTFVIVNRDCIRRMLRKPHGEAEGLVTHIHHEAIRSALAMAYHVICDDTNLNQVHLNELQSIAEENHADFRVEGSFLSVPVAECMRRNSARPREERIPNGVIRAMYETWRDQWPAMPADEEIW